MFVIEFVYHELIPDSSDDPGGYLDATRQAREAAGDTVYTSSLRGSAEFSGASSGTIVFSDLPDGSAPHVIKAYRKNPDGTVQSVTRMEEKFTPDTGALLVTFGETSDVKVLYEVWI
jgi:hypothetical protein